MNKKTVTIIGWGELGFSLAYALAHTTSDKNIRLKYYDTNEDNYPVLIEHGVRATEASLLNSPLPENVEIIQTIEEACLDTDIFFVTTPAQFNTSIAEHIRDETAKPEDDEPIIVGTTPCLDPTTGKRPSQLYAEALEGKSYHYVFMPLIDQVDAFIRSERTTVLLSSFNEASMRAIDELLSCDTIDIHHNPTDLESLEHTSGYGSVLSLYSGLLAGYGLSDSTVSNMTTSLAHQIEMYWIEQGVNPDLLNLNNKAWASSNWIQPTRQEADYQLGLMVADEMPVDDAIASVQGVESNAAAAWQLEALSQQQEGIRASIQNINTLIKLLIEKDISSTDAYSLQQLVK